MVPLAAGQSVLRALPAGQHQIGVLEMEANRRAVLPVEVTEPVTDPNFTLTAAGWEVTLTVTAARADVEAVLGWGDDTPPTRRVLTVGDEISHRYRAADLYLVQAGYPDTRPTAKQITIHSGGTR